MKIAHLTSVHHRYDTRIFLKMCRGAAAAGNQVYLVVADGLGNENREGVNIIDVGRAKGRISQIIKSTGRVRQQATKLGADVYHLHDPELLPTALSLQRKGKRVVFDFHEDVPRDIQSKYYLHPMARNSIASAFGFFERYAARRVSQIVTATPTIRDKFRAIRVPAVDINNYPLLGELDAGAAWENKERHVCYVGSLTSIRGVSHLVEAMASCKTDAKLELGGKFDQSGLRDKLVSLPGWGRVIEKGYLDRTAMKSLLGRCVAGLVTFLPEPKSYRRST